jgi:hypothetical protein
MPFTRWTKSPVHAASLSTFPDFHRRVFHGRSIPPCLTPSLVIGTVNPHCPSFDGAAPPSLRSRALAGAEPHVSDGTVCASGGGGGGGGNKSGGLRRVPWAGDVPFEESVASCIASIEALKSSLENLQKEASRFIGLSI